MQQGVNRRMSPNAGMSMKQMVARNLGPVNPGASYPQPSTLNPAESARNYNITAHLNSKNWMGNIIQRVVLPWDIPAGNATGDDQSKAILQAQARRQAEFMRQSAQPWGSGFMHTPTDDKRLNNPQQAAFVNQRQLNVGSTYGQFYAFMHALSAAFGNLQAR